MTDIPDRFAGLIDELTRLGSPIGRYLRPGLPAGALNEALAPLQLAPPSELIDWFGLQDGPDDDGYQQAEPDGSPLEVFPGVRLLSLNEAVTLGLEMRRSAEELGEDAEQFWRPDWLPIAYGPGSTFAVPCPAESSNDPATVWRSLSHPGPSNTGRVTGTIADLIDRWTAEIRAGNVYWDKEFRSLEPREGEAVRLEAEGLY